MMVRIEIPSTRPRISRMIPRINMSAHLDDADVHEEVEDHEHEDQDEDPRVVPGHFSSYETVTTTTPDFRTGTSGVSTTFTVQSYVPADSVISPLAGPSKIL